MSALKIGGLFFGYGGLDMAVQSVLGGDLAWVSEFDKGANKIIAHRYPDVPNIGDITKVDWTQVEPVDVLTGGSPCQDLSHAGKRAGMTEGTRSNLWVAMREAIAVLRPSLVVWENVRGAYSAAADSSVEPCPGCVGDGSGVHLRALGRVLGDLSELGYDAQWHGLRAADVGAPHGRFRVFVAAFPSGVRRGAWWTAGSGEAGCGRAPADAAGRGDASLRHDPNLSAIAGLLLPTPAVNDMGEGKTVEAWDEWTATMKAKHANGNGHGKSLNVEAQPLSLDVERVLLPTPSVADSTGGHERRGGERGEELLLKGVARAAAEGALLPTPRATDGTKGGPNQRGSSGDLMLPSAVNNLAPEVNAGTGLIQPDGAVDAPDEAKDALLSMRPASGALLPTPTATDAKASGASGYDSGHDGTTLTDATVRQPAKWGQYVEAITRWESLTRPAPAPTELGPKGSPRLSARFSEWMMGLPDGWITDVPGITRNEALKAAGNGVVPQQAAAALRLMLARASEVAA